MNSNTANEHKILLTLAIPMILSNITTPLLGLVDTAVVGHLPNAYFLGATAVGAMIISIAIWFCGFLRMSTTGLVAQALGANKPDLNSAILLNGLLVASAIAVFLIVFQYPFIELGLLITGASPEVTEFARQYCQIRVWGYPASLANVVILGWLLGNHKAKQVMWLLMIINSSNILLDLLFVVVFDWQVAGVAWATLCAEYLGLSIGIYLIINILPESQRQAFLPTQMLSTLKRVAWQKYLSINRDIILRTLCLQITFTCITVFGARMGDQVVAANAILMNFLLLISFGLDGIANAAEVRVGKACGENNFLQVLLASKVAAQWTVVFALVYCLLFVFAGTEIIHLISDLESVTTYAEHYIFWIALLPLVCCWCFLLDGIYIGLTRAKIMRNSMIISTFLIFFPAWYLLQPYENHGLWAAFTLFMAARGITLGFDFYRQIQNKSLLPACVN